MQAEAAQSSLPPIAGADRLVAALQKAAAATGSDFHYLLGTAMRESSLKPNAQSGSSSATGLFQFIDQTWLGLVKEHGAQHGLGDFAAAITKQADGRYRADTGAKQNILALRKDPEVCALMAGEYAKSTQGTLRAGLGRDVCGGELYAAHFLGPDAALKLIKLAASDPNASAAAQFPQAASANKGVFLHGDGTPKTVREVYDWALRQPGAAGTLRAPQVAETAEPSSPQEAMVKVVHAQDAQVQMLLASVMNWQPQHGMFGAMFGSNDSTPSSAMSFGSGLLGILSDARNRQF
ncbi:MAG TPA: transglycosylase SLT domain-containing protein [Rhizomicrobium sp.]|nr:transglycosylase SLT domain-containing protein [Rhizomicrobium sp.]